MTTFRKLSIGLAAMATMWGTQVSQVMAQSEPRTEAEVPDQSRQFSAESGEIVMKGQELMARDQYEAALNTLSESLSLDGLSPYEQSIIYQMQGSCFYELNLYEEAIIAFENAIKSGGLLKNQRRALELNIAQLLIASDQFEKGALLIEKWHRDGGQLKKGHIEMLWQAWSQAGRYDRALPWAEQWFNAASPKTRKHFDTLNFLYNNLGMPEKQMDVIEQMIEKWPNDKTLWDALASMLANNGREQDAFELKLRQYDAGLMSEEAALLQLVQYHSFYGIPFQGAQLMQRELENNGISKTADHYSDLADLWHQAREYDRAIPVLEQAAALSGREAAPVLSKLAEAHYHQGDCEQARETIRKIKALGSDNLASLFTQLGVCLYEKSQDLPKNKCIDGKNTNSQRSEIQKLALNAFAASTDHPQGRDKSVHKTALSWTNFIKGEKASSSDICYAIVVVERDQCFQHISQAYAAKILVGTVKIDQSCLKYKDRYDALYRPRAIDQ